MNGYCIKSSGSRPEEAARMATACPLDVLRSIWLMHVLEQRAAFLEEAHDQREGAPR